MLKKEEKEPKKLLGGGGEGGSTLVEGGSCRMTSWRSSSGQEGIEGWVRTGISIAGRVVEKLLLESAKRMIGGWERVVWEGIQVVWLGVEGGGTSGTTDSAGGVGLIVRESRGVEWTGGFSAVVGEGGEVSFLLLYMIQHPKKYTQSWKIIFIWKQNFVWKILYSSL